MKTFILCLSVIFTLLLTGCEFENPLKPSKAELQLKQKELDTKLAQEKQKLDVQKELELAKINTDFQKEKLASLYKEKEARYQLQLQEKQQELELQRYIILLTALVIIIIAIGVYIYFNNRRKDKLKSYEDNLEKYFKNKEEQNKLQIANKIIDTIATGKLSLEQEKRLIANLDGKETIDAQTLQGLQDEEIVDAVVLENKPKKKSKKKKKKNKKRKEEE